MTGTDVDKYLSFYETETGRSILESEAGYLRGQLRGCGRILDIGCGPGVFERELTGLDITGVDPSDEMLEAARKNAGNEFVRARAERLPFPDASFDCVFFVASLEFTGDHEKALDEAARVLCKGGRLVILMLNPKSGYFKRMMEKEGYTRGNIKHALNPKDIERRLSGGFEVSSGYMLGIEGGRTFESCDPEKAALYAVKGVKR